MATRLNAQQRMERDRKAADLRLAGTSYETIASSLGYANKSHSWKAVQSVLLDSRRETGEALLTLELERLDAIQRRAFRDALSGDLKAIATVLRVMDHRAKLTGLYEVQAETNDDEIRSALAGFLADAQAQVGASDATILRAPTEPDATIERQDAA
jgi:hypothetical protein